MSENTLHQRQRRLLLLAPTGKGTRLISAVLAEGGIACDSCRDIEEVVRELEVGSGALLIAEEALDDGRPQSLVSALEAQPAWSDLPILILTGAGADSMAISHAVESLGNVTLLERPTRVAAIVSAVRTALRARQRQYQIRDQLEDRERHFHTQALLASIVASSDDAIISKNLDSTILSWNAGAERLFGYSPDEAIGRSIMLLIPPERQHEDSVLLERLRRGERIEHFETVRVAKDGRRIDISLTVSPIRDASGRIVGASKVARDITPRKEADAALREADRRKDEFLAILAHELRNPLAPIRNSLHILRLAGSLEPAAAPVCEMIERQVDHMVRLVDDLMEVSRITRGKIELRREQIELAAVIRSAVETSMPLIDSKSHQLAVSLPKEPILLNADLMRLAQVFCNLLNNAAKYTADGGQISIAARPEGEQVVIAIRDTGMGISAEMLPRVFEMFTQTDRTSGRSQGGLGIGLALVRALVEMHGGRVEARSAGPGQGSEFLVRLSWVSGSGRVPPAPLQPKQVASVLSRRVLVVDDNRDAADSLGMLLRFLGADVMVVYDGPSALATVDTFQPAVVFLDIGMPEMDGHEVARRIHENPGRREITLIALTGWSQEEDRRRTRVAGFDYHMIKPADLHALQALLVSLESSAGASHTRG